MREKCPYCGDDDMTFNHLTQRWECLQPDCPIDDLTQEELAKVKAERIARQPESSLYRKYIVGNANGDPIDPSADYFVLRLDTDPAARSAARIYAQEVAQVLPALAEELIDKLDQYDFGGDRYDSAS